MKYMVHVEITTDEGQTETREIACLEREDFTPTTLGLTLAEGKAILKALQEVVVEQQMLAYLKTQRPCAHCGNLSSKCFAFVQTYDQKPERRLFEVLRSQGHQLNQQITFLSDGGDTVRDLQLYLNPHAEHLLDWVHVAMRLTVLQQTAKGVPDKTRDEEEDYPLRDPVVRERVLNGDWEATFREWYPGFRSSPQPMAA